ncbi:hypothetical protein BESB_074860 [Besnoitia besnoiti]|uniref:Uncharacterized protein n=1 Tax=Besnoitia besnoiti TaxID=94643 RepID=A0A2A9MAW6_BESBE|nr:uncharacterized protein BESB_074860 [Besnoitia besnoiti]PFH34334.1 hypothetical protein BESB_074860 [Besnoitia besnoiti]
MVSQPKPLGSCELKERSASAAFRCSSPRSPPYSSVLSSSISSSASASVPFASSSVACLPPADEARQAVALASSSSFLTGGSADSPILSSGEPLPWGVPFSVSSGCSTGAPCAPSVSCSGEMREDESESSKQEPHSSSSISASPEVVSARLPRRRTKRGVKRALSARPSRAAFLVALRRRVRTSASGECVNRASPSAGPPSSSAPGAVAGGLLLLHLARVALLAFDPQKRGRRLRSRSRPQAGAPPATRACTDLSWSPVGVSAAPLPTAGRDTLSRSEARSTADEALDKKRARTAETGEAGEAPRRKSRRGGAARAKAGRADCGAEDAAETSEWGEGGREGKVATSVRGSQATDSEPPEVAVPAPSENSPPTTQGDAPLRGPRQGGRRPACAGVCKTSRSVGSEIVGCGATIKEIGDYLCEHLHQTDSPAFRTNLSRFLQECIDGTFIKRVRRGVYALTAQAVVSSVCSASPFSVFQRSFARSLPLSTGDRTAAVLCRKLALHGGEETKAQQTADAQATATQQGGPYSGAERRCEGAAGRQHKDDETALQREFCDSEATDLQGGGPGGSPAVRAVAAKDPGGSCSRDRDTGKRFGDCSGGEVSREAAARGEREGLAESMTRMDTAETAASSTAEEIESPRCNFESELADEVANPHVVPSESVGRFAGGINKEAGPVAESVVLTCTTSSSWISLTSLASPSSPSSSLPSPLVASGASSVSFPDPYHALAASPSLSSSSSASTLAARVECPSLVFPAALCEQALPAAPAPVSYYLKRPSLDASSADDSSTKLLGRSSFIFASSTLRHAGVRRGSPFSLSAPKQIFGRPALPAQIGFLTLEKKLRGPMRAASCLPAQAAAARLGETASSAGGSCAARGPAAPGEGTDVCCPAGSGEGTRARVGTCRERCVAGRLRKGSAPQHAANGVGGAGLVFGDLSWKRKSVKVEKEVERGAWGGRHPSGGRAAEETNFGETQAKRRRTMRPARGTDAANQAAEVRLEAADAQKAENSGDKGSETGREKPTPKRRGRPPKRAQGVEPVSSDTRVRELCSSAEPQLHHPPDKVAGEPQLGAAGAERCRAASFRLPFCALDNLQMKPRRAPGRPHGSVEDLCERVKKHGRELPVTKSESAEERRSAQRRKRGGSGEHRVGEERNPLSGGKQHALRPCLSRKQRDCRQSEKLRREESNGLQSAVVRKRAFDTVEDVLHALEFSPRNQKGEDARELEADEAAVSASYPAEGLPPPEGDENERMEKGGALHGRPGRTGERLRRGRRRKAADGDVPAASARVGRFVGVIDTLRRGRSRGLLARSKRQVPTP